MNSIRLRAVAALCLALPFAQPLPAATAPDFTAAREEMLHILTGFIRVDTSNPPGNETRGAEYLKAFLDREGIASEILELEKGRGNLIARLKGSGKARPLALMGHIDVVGVEREKWTVEPFGGVIKDGFVYGRGASDDKGMTSACLEVFLLLHRLKVPLDRDIILIAEAGEEATTHVGIDFLVAKHWDKIACEFVLNEGGRIFESNGKVQYVGVSTAEKVPRPIILSAKGSSGHASRPRPDNPVVRLAMAVAKVGNWQAPMRLNDTTRAFFQRLATISDAEDAFLFTNLEDPSMSSLVQEKIRVKHLGYNAMLRTTLTPTVLKGGFRINVIPGDAIAMVDCRALPDEQMDKLCEQLRKLIDDPLIEVIPPERGRPATPPSRHDTAMFAALERAQQKHFPGAVTIPMMLTGATDSAQMRAKGVQAYGLGSVSTDEESNRVHGNDERISIAGLGRFLEFLWTAVTDVAAAK
jgi:acetylornithine deacetylase/succinyl-diaminopimelate desuccinylase-like protein